VEDGKFEGGLGGSVSNGEWQVELSHRAQDPRDPSRSTGGAPIPLLPASAVDESEEFPALPTDNRPSNLQNINWLKSKEKADQFPGLPSRKSSSSAKDKKLSSAQSTFLQ
jgi:hypothetical protein